MKIVNYLGVPSLLMAVLVVTMGVSTAQPPRQGTTIEEDQRERYAHRFTPPEGEWISESDVPAEPQIVPRSVIWEVSSYLPDSEPTAQQRQAADDLVDRSFEAAAKNGWFDANKGAVDGYALMYGDVTHYVNEEYMLDDAVLDPERPEVLMYYETPEGRKLVGFMFVTNETLAQGPQIGGPLTVWHYHMLSLDACYLGGVLVVGQPANGECARGSTMPGRGPEMIHVWLIDHPQGDFGSQMSIGRNDLLSALERRFSERGY